MPQLLENNVTETTALPHMYFVSWPPYRSGYTDEQRSDWLDYWTLQVINSCYGNLIPQDELEQLVADVKTMNLSVVVDAGEPLVTKLLAAEAKCVDKNGLRWLANLRAGPGSAARNAQ